MRNDTPRLRLGMIGVLAISLFMAMFARLWYLQVLASPDYQLQASANQRREIIEPAPRGRILDRNGVVIVDNRLSFIVSLDRTVLRDLEEADRADVLARVTAEISQVEPGITVAVVEQRLASNRFSPYTPVPVAEDVPEDLAVYLTENRADFHEALHVESRAIRTYPYGQLAAHVLGYVGAINDEEFQARRQSSLAYQLTDEIGKSGVELTYEDELRGQPGRRVLEVDARGDTIRELDYQEPVAGHDIRLSIDVRVQAVAEVALGEELARARERRLSDGTYPDSPAGSVVVTDPNNGSILAMASYPTYNPAAFTDGIDDPEWAYLNDPANFYPLINRTIQGQYAPGSTFKLITAYAGLASGAITPQSTLGDGGVFRVPGCTGGSCTFRNSGSRAWGRVNLQRALTVSSDVFFYDLGARFWIDRDSYGDPIQTSAEQFGLGADTGVPLPNELSGWIPTPENTAQRHEDNPTAFPYGEWFTGNNVNMAVGQGDVVVTPLQLANAYATLTNGGTRYAPNIVLDVERSGSGEVIRTYEARPVGTVEFQPGWREAMMAGFTGVTQSGEGTAHGTFAGFPTWIVAGKTGTAEVDDKADTSLFVGMAPVEAPRYTAAAILEESGFGGQAAGPLIRRIFESAQAFEAIPGSPTQDVVVSDPLSPTGYTLSIQLAEAADPLTSGDRGD